MAVSPVATGIELFKNEQSSFVIGGFFNIDTQQSDGDTNMSDTSSRISFDFNHSLSDGWRAEAYTEWALNLVENEQSLIFSSGGDSLSSSPDDAGDTVSLRHGWVGLYHEKWGEIKVGKQWAAYYDVAATTDQWIIWGGNASGAFNYGTDGGVSGTGRAEKSITYRNTWNNISIGLQYQAKSSDSISIYECQRNPNIECEEGDLGPVVDEAKYDFSYGGSIIYQTPWNIALGVAYNRSEIDGEPDILGFDDDYEDAFIVGATYGQWSDELYFAINYYEGTNHELDDLGIFFDSEGIEVYAGYEFMPKWKVILAYNDLQRDDDNHKGQYEVSYMGGGIHYYWSDNLWLYTEIKIEDSKLTDGTEADNIYAIGVRYNL